MRYLVSLISLLFLMPALVRAAHPEKSKAPTGLVEIRGEQVPFYENLQGLGTPRTVKPEFPRDAHGKRVSGSAVVGVLVDEKGNPIDVEIIESKPVPACGESAAAAVRKWHFPKVKREGRPTKYLVRVPMVFDYQM